MFVSTQLDPNIALAAILLFIPAMFTVWVSYMSMRSSGHIKREIATGNGEAIGQYVVRAAESARAAENAAVEAKVLATAVRDQQVLHDQADARRFALLGVVEPM